MLFGRSGGDWYRQRLRWWGECAGERGHFMRMTMRLRNAVLAAALVVGGPAFGANVEELTKQLSGEAALVAKTPGELERAYAEVLPSLLAKAETDDVGLQKVAFRASRPGAEAERAALWNLLTGVHLRMERLEGLRNSRRYRLADRLHAAWRWLSGTRVRG